MGWKDSPIAEEQPKWANSPTAPEPQAPGRGIAVSPLETFGTEYAEAWLPNSTDEAGGVVQALLQASAKAQALVPGIRERLPAWLQQEQATDSQGQAQGLLDTYREGRDENRMRRDAGLELNKDAAKWGTRVGIASQLPMAAKAVASGVTGAAAKTLPQMMKAGGLAAGKMGAGYGALGGLMGSEADLTRPSLESFARAGIDTVAGGVTGGVVGGVIGAAAPVAMAAAKPIVDPLAKYTSSLLRKAGIGLGRRVIQGGSDIASATRRPLSDEAVETALEMKAIRPLRDTESTYRRLEDLAKKEGDVYGKILDDLEARGVRGPDADRLATEIFDRFSQEYPNTSADKTAINRYADEALNLVDPAVTRGQERLGLRQTENIKQSLQRGARYERLKQNAGEEVLEDVASMVRQANEDAILEQAGSNKEIAVIAEQFVPTKRRLGNLLEARAAAERGASKQLQRPTVGLKDVVIGAGAGDPTLGFATAMGSSVLRSAAPSTLARGSYGASKALMALVKSNPAQLAELVGPGPARALIKAAGEGEQRFAAVHYMLSMMNRKRSDALASQSSP